MSTGTCYHASIRTCVLLAKGVGGWVGGYLFFFMCVRGCVWVLVGGDRMLCLRANVYILPSPFLGCSLKWEWARGARFQTTSCGSSRKIAPKRSEIVVAMMQAGLASQKV